MKWKINKYYSLARNVQWLDLDDFSVKEFGFLKHLVGASHLLLEFFEQVEFLCVRSQQLRLLFLIVKPGLGHSELLIPS